MKWTGKKEGARVEWPKVSYLQGHASLGIIALTQTHVLRCKRQISWIFNSNSISIALHRLLFKLLPSTADFQCSMSAVCLGHHSARVPQIVNFYH